MVLTKKTVAFKFDPQTYKRHSFLFEIATTHSDVILKLIRGNKNSDGTDLSKKKSERVNLMRTQALYVIQ